MKCKNSNNPQRTPGEGWASVYVSTGGRRQKHEESRAPGFERVLNLLAIVLYYCS